LEASKTPKKRPFVAEFLQSVTAIDIVESEGQLEMDLSVTYPSL
jgi:hypothetical protein